MRAAEALLPAIYHHYPGLRRRDLEEMPAHELLALLADLSYREDAERLRG